MTSSDFGLYVPTTKHDATTILTKRDSSDWFRCLLNIRESIVARYLDVDGNYRDEFGIIIDLAGILIVDEIRMDS